MSAGPLAFVDAALDDLRQQGLFRPLRVLDGEQAARASVDGRSVVNLSSNNYLGLTTHPALRERALDAVRSLGVGTGSVRPIAGTMALHMELERRLAAFKRTEAAVVFQSGFTANAGTVASLLGRLPMPERPARRRALAADGRVPAGEARPARRRRRPGAWRTWQDGQYKGARELGG